MYADFPTGIAALADNYDGFVFDLWGVLHDGVSLFPGVLPALAQLRQQGKKIGILSNSPRPVADAAKNIAQKFSLTPDLYDALLTSGQLAYEALRDRPDAWLQALGTRCLPIGPAHEIAPYRSLALEFVEAAAAADFVLCTGLAHGKARLEDYEVDMAAWRERGLRLLCANPDRVVMRQDQFGIAAGAIAEAYRALGGQVRDDYGKPDARVFTRVLAQLEVMPQRALMVGDNLATDISGAISVGMGSLWITGGVHAPELERLGVTAREQLHAYLSAKRLGVKHIMPEVLW